MKEHKDMKVVKGSMQLSVKFTPEEMERIASVMAQAVAERNEAEGQLAGYKAQIQGRIKTANALINESAEKHRAGKEFRDVDIETQFDFKEATVTVYRMDSLEQVSVRPMTNDEKQMELEVDPPTNPMPPEPIEDDVPTPADLDDATPDPDADAEEEEVMF